VRELHGVLAGRAFAYLEGGAGELPDHGSHAGVVVYNQELGHVACFAHDSNKAPVT